MVWKTRRDGSVLNARISTIELKFRGTGVWSPSRLVAVGTWKPSGEGIVPKLELANLTDTVGV